MRRIPVAFWWIAAFCVAQAVAVFNEYRIENGEFDRAIFWLHGSAFLFVPVLLLMRLRAGHWLATVLLGLEAVAQSHRLFESYELRGTVETENALLLLFTASMFAWLLRPAVACEFEAVVEEVVVPVPEAAQPMHKNVSIFAALDFVLALIAGLAAGMLGAPLWLAFAAGVTIHYAAESNLEEWLRQCWELHLSRSEPGIPADSIKAWRAAARALSRNKLAEARKHFERMTALGRVHPSAHLFGQTLKWQEQLNRPPNSGREIFVRALLDHEYVPDDDARRKLHDFVRSASEDELREITGERAAFVERLCDAAATPGGFMYARAARVLARISGESYAFHASENWSDWWRVNHERWCGDAGPVAAAVRLMMRGCHDAAVEVARKTCLRAEEPLLLELAGQMQFVGAIRSSASMSREFMKAPLRVLLVPDYADAAGWLHADSPHLAEFGITPKALARRLLLRTKLIDYAASLWQRYPADLNEDLPGLLGMLAGKNFSLTPVRFDAWWPEARDSQVRFARAFSSGLEAFERGAFTVAEDEFRRALFERPNDLSARYNLALCRIRTGDRAGAESLLRELTDLEPKESYWWMQLGDLHRSANQASSAREAYRRAQELGAAEGNVALHVGLTFAREERTREAIQQLDISLGKDPSPRKLESLASMLENEGFWKLAGHYREEALRRELGIKFEEEE